MPVVGQQNQIVGTVIKLDTQRMNELKYATASLYQVHLLISKKFLAKQFWKFESRSHFRLDPKKILFELPLKLATLTRFSSFENHKMEKSQLGRWEHSNYKKATYYNLLYFHIGITAKLIS